MNLTTPTALITATLGCLISGGLTLPGQADSPPQASDQLPTPGRELPPELLLLSGTLAALDGPIEYTVAQEQYSIALDLDKQRSALRDRIMQWGQGTSMGTPPPFDVALAQFRAVAQFHLSAPDHERRSKNTISFSRSGGITMHAKQSETGLFKSTRIGNGEKIFFQSSLNRIRISASSPTDGQYFVTPGTLVAPLGTSPEHSEWVESSDWTPTRSGDRISASAFTTRVQGSSFGGFTACFDRSSAFPKALLDDIRLSPDDPSGSIVLSLFDTEMDFEAGRTAFGFRRVLQFDLFAVDGMAIVTSYTIHAAPLERNRKAQRAAGDPIPTTGLLPVRFSEKTSLYDVRIAGEERAYDGGPETWPEEILAMIRPF